MAWADLAQLVINGGNLQFFWPGLALVFVAAKLFGAINWAWIWVLSPVWGLALVYMLLFALIGLGHMAKK